VKKGRQYFRENRLCKSSGKMGHIEKILGNGHLSIKSQEGLENEREEVIVVALPLYIPSDSTSNIIILYNTNRKNEMFRI
jgi:hypothetical protein